LMQFVMSSPSDNDAELTYIIERQPRGSFYLIVRVRLS